MTASAENTPLNVHQLSGTELDRFVAEVIQMETYYDGDKKKIMYQADPKLPKRQWAPSKFWSQAGPIIEEMKIDLNWEWEEANMWTASIEPDINTRGKSILEAAMRAVVATRYQQEFNNPDEVEKRLQESLTAQSPIP